jgi:hypothetical protein
VVRGLAEAEHRLVEDGLVGPGEPAEEPLVGRRDVLVKCHPVRATTPEGDHS